MIVIKRIPHVTQIKSLLRSRNVKSIEARGEVIKQWGMEMGITKGYAASCKLICSTEGTYKAFKDWFYNLYPNQQAQ